MKWLCGGRGDTGEEEKWCLLIVGVTLAWWEGGSVFLAAALDG